MMAGLWRAVPKCATTFAEASDALSQDLWELVTDGPADALNQTVNTQPAMLAAGVAVYRVWQAAGGATPALHGRPQPGRIQRRWSRPARWPLPMRSAGALPRRSDAGCRARRRRRDGGDSWPGRRCRACRLCRGGARRSAGGGEPQFPRPGGDRRQQGRGGARHGAGQGKGRQARACRCRSPCRRIPADEAGGRKAAARICRTSTIAAPQYPGAAQCRCAKPCRCGGDSRMRWRASCIPRCAGSRPCRP